MQLAHFFRNHKRRQLAKKGYSGTEKVRRKESFTDRHVQGGRILVPLLVVLVVWGFACLVTLSRSQHSMVEFVAGQVSDRFVYSDVPFEYDDMVQTNLNRQHALSQVAPVYGIDLTVADQALLRLDFLRRAVVPQKAPTPPVDPPSVKVAPSAVAPVKAVPVKVTPAKETYPGLETLLGGMPEEMKLAFEYLGANANKWEQLRKLISLGLERGVVSPMLQASSIEKNAVNGKIYLKDRLGRLSLAEVSELATPKLMAQWVVEEFGRRFPENVVSQRAMLLETLPAVILPNLVYEAEATQKAKDQAAMQVPVVRQRVQAGKALVERGTVVTPDILQVLNSHEQALKAQRRLSESRWDVCFHVLITLLLVVLAGYAMMTIRPSLQGDSVSIMLIGLVVVLQMLCTRGVTELYFLNWHSKHFLYPMLPLALGAMLLAQLIGLRVALLAGGLTSVVAGLQSGGSLEVMFIGWFAASTGAMLMRRATRRYHGFRAGFGAGGMAFVICALFLLRSELPWQVLKLLMPQMLVLALFGGVVTAVTASAILPFFEFAFGVTTDISLLELSDLNHPLLKQLQLQAPGTYHHSLLVATLAEQAAEAIGANPLLARVCAYFHDIGKIRHPDYFSENIWGADPHAELQPRMSSLVILNHVKEGIDLALKYKLKKPIREAIAQHHGTSLVYFFYHRALVQKESHASDCGVGEQEYRYPGPLPVRKEIAIISLADSCEAAARALEKPTPQKIATLVNEIFLKRIRDGQMDQANLTLREMTVVRQTIGKSLGTMLHARVKYPDEKDKREGDLFQAAEKTETREPESDAESHPVGAEAN
jgi:putative nucleotidyltransferase with HDIG domain